jgi:hypothetical protein
VKQNPIITATYIFCVFGALPANSTSQKQQITRDRGELMRRYIRRGIVLGIIGIAAGALLVSSRPAEAASCAAGATCIVELTNTNVTGVDIDIRVTINNTGSATILTVAFISDNITNTPLGIDQFGYNSTAVDTVLPTGFSQASCPKGGCVMDGFGAFVSEIDSPAGTLLSFTLELNSLVTSFTENGNGSEFAAHVRYSGNCSGFVSDGTASGPTPNANCTGVPEPASMLLLATGLVSTGGLLGTRLRSRRNVAVA